MTIVSIMMGAAVAILGLLAVSTGLLTAVAMVGMALMEWNERPKERPVGIFIGLLGVAWGLTILSVAVAGVASFPDLFMELSK